MRTEDMAAFLVDDLMTTFTRQRDSVMETACASLAAIGYMPDEMKIVTGPDTMAIWVCDAKRWREIFNLSTEIRDTVIVLRPSWIDDVFAEEAE